MTNTYNILWTITWQSAVLAAMVGIVVTLFGKWITPRFRYLLWGVVLLRLMLPVLPMAPWGLWDRHAVTPVTHAKIEPVTPPQMFVPQTIENVVQTSPPQRMETKSSPVPVRSHVNMDWKAVILAVWVTGIVVFGLRYMLDELRLYRRSRYWKPVGDPRLLALLQRCRKEVGVRRRVELLSVSHGIGAAATGLFRPKILLSEQAVSTGLEQLRMVLLHELTHIRRFDPLVLRLATLLTVIHWPNPAAWLAASRLGRERELACDAAVLDRLGSVCRKEYGDTVLTFAELFSVQERLPGLVGVFLQNAMTRRIDMIRNYKKSWPLHTILGGLLVLAVVGFGLTKAQPQNQPQNQPQSQPRKQGEKDTQPASGVKVHGRVTDPNGKPVEGALLVWQTEPNGYWDNREKAAKTDKDGKYESPELKPMKGSVTVIAEGFSPDMKAVEFKAGMEVVDFSLKPGKTLEIHFVDPDGKPVPGIKLGMGSNPDHWWRIDSNIYNKSYACEEAMEKGLLPDPKIPYIADENGVYRWTWAPEDKVMFIFSKEGYMMIFSDPSKEQSWFVAGEKPHKIVMYPAITTSGTVVDDETGKPIESFKARYGNIIKNYSPGGIIWQPPQMEEFKDGRFEYPISFFHDEGYRIRVDADGYESFISDDIKLGETRRQFDIRLKKIAGLSGTVLLPDGSPAAGTKIYVAGDGGYLQVSNPPDSDLLRWRSVATTADEAGKFTLTLKPEDPFGIYFEHPQGITWVRRGEFLNNREVHLRGFAKLEVIVPPEYSDGPEAHISLMGGLYGDGFGHIDYQKELKPGETHYTFDKIVTGKNRFAIWKKSPDHVCVQGSGAREAIDIPFEIKEGETKTMIDLILAGTTVTGNLTLPESVQEAFAKRDWSYNYVVLTSRESQEAVQSKWSAFMTPSPTEARTGMFRFDRIPPGEYVASVTLFKAPEDTTTMHAPGKPLGTYLGTVTVTENQKTAEVKLDTAKRE